MTVLILLIFYSLALISSKPITNEEKLKTLYGGDRVDINIVDLDKNIAIVCERLRTLDAILTEMYQDPPIDGGEKIMILSRTYNQACLDLLRFCSMDKYKTLKAAQEIVDHGGPKFFDVEMDDKKLEERFKWNEEAVDNLHVLRKYTHEHWYDLYHLYKNLPD